jgi:tight adherence protein B
MVSVVVAPLGALTALVLARVGRRAAAADRVRALRRERTRLPGWLEARLEVALRAAALAVAPEAAVQYWLLAIVVAGGLGLALSPALAVFGTVSAAVGGPLALVAARGRGRRRVASAVPNALERCAIELRGGGTIASAVATVAAGDGPLAADFARIRDRCALGASLGDATAQWANERDAPGVRATAGALALATTVGGACADALDGLAASLRGRLAVLDEARALASQARLSAIVVGASPIAYLAWSVVVDPGSLHALTGTAVGRVCLVAAIGMEALAVMWMRRILREEPGWS